MVTKQRAVHPSHHKRHGLHQKQTKPFIKVYWPYLPLFFVMILGLVLNNAWPNHRRGVLAYATSISTVDLLNSTNQQRTANGIAALSLNGQLNQAAQAKANDMATRNYWSHNTPEGNPPWIFITQAGYAYSQAGENLAYGFDSSSDTITGWMNSPPHRENLLNGSFVDVGFGFANSSDYQNSGPETIVVAMYGKPATTPAPAAAAAKPAPPAAAPTSTAVAKAAPTVQAQAETPTPPAAASLPGNPATTAPKTAASKAPDNRQTPLREPVTQQVSRLETLTDGQAPSSVAAIGIISLLSLAFLLVTHSLRLRRALVTSEHFVLKHTFLDVAFISVIMLAALLNRAAGFIR